MNYRFKIQQQARQQGKRRQMVDNQHKKIAGYRDLSMEEIELMNLVKAHGASIKNLLDHMKTITTIDQRWLAIGVTDLQKGFMGVIRSIAQPEGF